MKNTVIFLVGLLSVSGSVCSLSKPSSLSSFNYQLLLQPASEHALHLSADQWYPQNLRPKDRALYRLLSPHFWIRLGSFCVPLFMLKSLSGQSVDEVQASLDGIAEKYEWSGEQKERASRRLVLLKTICSELKEQTGVKNVRLGVFLQSRGFNASSFQVGNKGFIAVTSGWLTERDILCPQEKEESDSQWELRTDNKVEQALRGTLAHEFGHLQNNHYSKSICFGVCMLLAEQLVDYWKGQPGQSYYALPSAWIRTFGLFLAYQMVRMHEYEADAAACLHSSTAQMLKALDAFELGSLRKTMTTGASDFSAQRWLSGPAMVGLVYLIAQKQDTFPGICEVIMQSILTGYSRHPSNDARRERIKSPRRLRKSPWLDSRCWTNL